MISDEDIGSMTGSDLLELRRRIGQELTYRHHCGGYDKGWKECWTAYWDLAHAAVRSGTEISVGELVNLVPSLPDKSTPAALQAAFVRVRVEGDAAAQLDQELNAEAVAHETREPAWLPGLEWFKMTEERRRDNRDWPEWLNRAWNGPRGAVGSVYPTVDGTAEGTITVFSPVGEMVADPGDLIVRTSGGIYVQKTLKKVSREANRAAVAAARVIFGKLATYAREACPNYAGSDLMPERTVDVITAGWHASVRVAAWPRLREYARGRFFNPTVMGPVYDDMVKLEDPEWGRVGGFVDSVILLAVVCPVQAGLTPRDLAPLIRRAPNVGARLFQSISGSENIREVNAR